MGTLPTSLIGAIEKRKNRMEAHYKGVVDPISTKPLSTTDPDVTVILSNEDQVYLDALNRKDMEAVRDIIEGKIAEAKENFKADVQRGIRQGVYVDGVPLPPRFNNFYGPGYYIAEGTTDPDVLTGR